MARWPVSSTSVGGLALFPVPGFRLPTIPNQIHPGYEQVDRSSFSFTLSLSISSSTCLSLSPTEGGGEKNGGRRKRKKDEEKEKKKKETYEYIIWLWFYKPDILLSKHCLSSFRWFLIQTRKGYQKIHIHILFLVICFTMSLLKPIINNTDLYDKISSHPFLFLHTIIICAHLIFHLNFRKEYAFFSDRSCWDIQIWAFLFKGNNDRKLSSTDSVPKCPQWAGLEQAEVKGLELNAGLQAGFKKSNYLTYHLHPPMACASCCSTKPELSLKPKHSDMGQRHANRHFNHKAKNPLSSGQ